MSNLDVGINGATGQSWNMNNPRPILEKLIDDAPADPRLLSTRIAIFDELKDIITRPENSTLFHAILEYWFQNNYSSLLRNRNQPPLKARAQQMADATEKAKKELARRAVNFVMLELTMPNGKELRDCTGNDCKKLGGFWAKLTAKVKPNEKVGDVLTESQVKRLIS